MQCPSPTRHNDVPTRHENRIFRCAKSAWHRDPSEEILDSGSTVTLSKRKDEMKDLRDVEGNIIMSTNNGKKCLEQEGNWKEWGQTYLDQMALTNRVSVSDAV